MGVVEKYEQQTIALVARFHGEVGLIEELRDREKERAESLARQVRVQTTHLEDMRAKLAAARDEAQKARERVESSQITLASIRRQLKALL